MNTRILYIEKKKNFDRSKIAPVIAGIKSIKMEDVNYTINGEDIFFLSIKNSSDVPTLKRICSELERLNFRAMYSGVVHSTAITGVVRHGNCIGYKTPEEPGMLIQTDIIDNRCMISFPLVENRHIEKNIKFLPLNLELPTNIRKLDRMQKSMFVIEKQNKNINKEQYVEYISSLLAAATIIYPEIMIWERGEVPPEITRLTNALRGLDELPINTTPAYMIMTDSEREYCRIYLYVSMFLGDLGEHMIPMNAIIPPSVMIASERIQTQGARLPQGQLNGVGNNLEQLMNIHSYEDLEGISEVMGKIARNLFGTSEGARINFSNNPNGVKIQIIKPHNQRE